MLLADLVATADRVAATAKRSEKLVRLADLFSRCDDEELPVAVALLSGEPRQGRIGVGWATVSAVDAEPAAGATVEVLDLDRLLTELAGTAGPGSVTARTSALADFLARTTEPEADFTRRVLGGELRHGALASLVTDALARATGTPQSLVRRATMLCGDLAEVAVAARGGGPPALEAIGLTVGRPVQPMLAGSAPEVAAALEGCGRSSVEWKLDGIRIQVHRHGDQIWIFTRNLNDITSRLPGVSEVARALPATAFVLDGEAIGLGSDDRPDLFQDTMASAGRQGGGAGSDLVPRFFDCLHLDGVDLLDRPLRERRTALDGLVGALAVPSVLTSDAAVAGAVLTESLAAGHEGVVVKAVDSVYEAGRRGKNWRKVKPVKSLDLAVLAAEWGHGRRQGWLSNLHLGARSTDPGGGFVMVGKTFKGLTDALLTWQTEQLVARETSRSSYVVHVRPELIVEVALDGVQRSTRYPGGVALRFARVRRYRPDKDPTDADTIEAVQALL